MEVSSATEQGGVDVSTAPVSLMEKYLNDPSNDYRTLKFGDVMDGTIMRVDRDEILVDIALGLTDRAYIVYAGEILTEGSPDEIVSDPDVLDELAAAEARAARDQATADKVRRATEQAAAEDRARAEAERRRRAYSPYYDPLGPYGRPFYPAYPYGYPGYFGGGVLIRR